MFSGEEVAKLLGGESHGRHVQAPCPVCQPERRRDQRALSLKDRPGGGLLVFCHKSGCGFEDIMAASGLGADRRHRPGRQSFAQPEARRAPPSRNASRSAETLWKASRPIRGTIAETYLREARAITCALPPTLRFHPHAWHRPTGGHLPALVARVDGTSSFAVHRTFLKPDGTGKAAPPGEKAMLGPCAGGAVQLSSGRRIVVAEGVETALSLLCGLIDEPGSVLAALSASGMRRLCLPKAPGALLIACDGDPAGRRGAAILAERAFSLGWSVTIADPGDGRDFNDVLREGGGLR